MKLSRLINLITVIIAVGMVVFCTLMFQASKNNLIEARKHEATELLRFAKQLAEYEINRFERGELSKPEAEFEIATLLSKFSKGSSFIWANDHNAIARVHVKDDVIGKFQSSYAKYISALRDNEFHFIIGESRKPSSDELFLKLNTMTLIPKWDWMIGYGLYMDELNVQAWELSTPYFIAAFLTLMLMLIIVRVLLSRIQKSIGTEPYTLKQHIEGMERGNLTHAFSSVAKDSILSALTLLNKSLNGTFLDLRNKASNLNNDVKLSESSLEKLSQSIDKNRRHQQEIRVYLEKCSVAGNEYTDLIATLAPVTVKLHESAKQCFTDSERSDIALSDLRALINENKQRSEFLKRLSSKLLDTITQLRESNTSYEGSNANAGLIHHLEHLVNEELSELDSLSRAFLSAEEYLNFALDSALTEKVTQTYKSSTNIMQVCQEFNAFKDALDNNHKTKIQMIEQLEKDLISLAEENEKLTTLVQGLGSTSQKLENDLSSYKL
ncbi:cache domain-containing protein [Marinomonas mediterranea]|jgi:Signal transduction histidine kinase|uniref:Single Cache domain-containing protein n=1 Tax=Marinomonas mediterranea (strain ATCC 700492 / JCM 21426 / NBRC 103028 / MMB-1) TaxID=717774 RepID=F2JZF6_MARM1|nr:cache domain-containing protein [Marinomonas mediterranea]ADZ89739.1 hypothetical protein Marme_0440 [Marinomonas mediterranea MMB-1]WCN07832.1 hypothetical protein GV055_02270 [Marinomonas mediterranea]WCN11926.1 hypothetical protein GV054_02280 [Marinomonas mediterranea]WCN15964.1 hypothetical protein GV053_02200 [Marinomonas mediterranea MMB-1]